VIDIVRHATQRAAYGAARRLRVQTGAELSVDIAKLETSRCRPLFVFRIINIGQ
jgi:hypothetical protein